MTAYLEPIRIAALFFIVLANFISFPLLFWIYRKEGALTFWRGIIIYSFIFYLTSAFFLTLLPLPTKEAVANLTTPYYQLIPFRFVVDIIQKTVFVWNQPSTYLAALKQGVFLQVIFNVLMTVPFGIYLRYYFKKDLKTTIFLSFILSLFFEITQLTGVYGIYPRPYRLFDVDDLMLNTLGGVIGYGLTPIVVKFLPSREEINLKVEKSAHTIPLLRRAFAFLIDYAVANFIVQVTYILLKTPVDNGVKYIMIGLILGLTYWSTKGNSLGMRLLKIKLVDEENKKPSFLQSFSRSMLFMISFYLISYLFNIGLQSFDTMNVEDPWTFVALILGLLIYNAILYLHVIYAALLRKQPMFYEKITKTHLESTLDNSTDHD